ncbi:MAG: hypothetical protein LAT81_08850 [Oceanicaulis sp.]|nr:hypothetical protein [Oceanicaulis sp.]
MSYIKINVARPNGNPGAGGNKRDYITVIDADDIAVYPQRNSKGIVIEDSIVMKSGKYAIKVYGTTSTMEGTTATEGEQDGRGFMPQFAFKHPGDQEEILEFIQTHTNKNLIIGVHKCSTGVTRLYGERCAPMQLQVTSTDNNTENTQMLTFISDTKSPAVPAIYKGTFTYDEPLAIIPADEDEPNVAAGSGEYQLSDNTAPTAITGLQNAVDGGIYRMLGSGGSNPSTIAASATFILKDGVSYTAAAGSSITLKAFKTGASSFVFIEQSRD